MLKKRIILLLCAAAAVLTLVLLLRYQWAGPERTAGRMLDSLSAGRFGRAARCTVEGSLRIEEQSWSSKRLYKAVYGGMQYQITGCAREGDSAKLTVALTVIDLDALISETAKDSMESSLLQRLTGSSYRKKLLSRIRAGDVTYTLETASVYLVKESGRWKVDMDESSSFTKALTGGYPELLGY